MTRSLTSQLPYPQARSVKWNHPPGYRRPTWKPDMLDYKHYENHRNDFLLTPHARAAVKYGGIIWRLSVQSIDPDYVTAGPSSEVLATSRAKYFDHDEARYWDDELIDEEINIICGVYKIDTGMYYSIHHHYLQSLIELYSQLEGPVIKPLIHRGGQSRTYGRGVGLISGTGRQRARYGIRSD